MVVTPGAAPTGTSSQTAAGGTLCWRNVPLAGHAPAAIFHPQTAIAQHSVQPPAKTRRAEQEDTAPGRDTDVQKVTLI